MANEKTYSLFAGVNGAGKSTLYQSPYYNKSESRVNTDEIVQKIGDWRNIKDQMEAARIAVKQINDNIENGISFNQETTLSGKGILNTIKKAREHGFKVILNYVGLESEDLAKERVKQRVFKGGHDIPEETISKRYYESLRNLRTILPYCNEVHIYDNTNTLTLTAQMKNGNFTWSNECKWFTPIQKNYEIDQIKETIKKAGYHPTETLINDIKKINILFNKNHSVQDIKDLYNKIEFLDTERKEVINKTANDFIKAEKYEIEKLNEHIIE